MPMNAKLFGVSGIGPSDNATQTLSAPTSTIVFDEKIGAIGQRLRELGIAISDQGVQQLILKNGHAAATVMQKSNDELQQWAKENMLITIANTLNEIPHVRIQVSLLQDYITDNEILVRVFAYVQNGDQDGLCNWYRGALDRVYGRSVNKSKI